MFVRLYKYSENFDCLGVHNRLFLFRKGTRVGVRTDSCWIILRGTDLGELTEFIDEVKRLPLKEFEEIFDNALKECVMSYHSIFESCVISDNGQTDTKES